jgi:hypothetical protein
MNETFDLIIGDTNELLNKSNEPLIKIVLFNFKGKKQTVKSRCELCAFSEINEDTDLLQCDKTGLLTLDGAVCDEFNITRGLLQDIYNGCIK